MCNAQHHALLHITLFFRDTQMQEKMARDWRDKDEFQRVLGMARRNGLNKVRAHCKIEILYDTRRIGDLPRRNNGHLYYTIPSSEMLRRHQTQGCRLLVEQQNNTVFRVIDAFGSSPEEYSRYRSCLHEINAAPGRRKMKIKFNYDETVEGKALHQQNNTTPATILA